MITPSASLVRRKRRISLAVAGAGAALVALFLLSVSWGSVDIPLADIVKIFLGEEPERATWTSIVYRFRLPKALTAILVGAGLSASGLMMQTLFRNPLAGPFVLGINAGASLGVALVVLATTSSGFVWLQQVGGLGAWTLVVAATTGAALVLGLVALVAVHVSDSATLLIIGLMFSSATSALVSILQYFSEAERIQAFLIWTFGSLGGVTWTQMAVFAPVIGVGLLITFFLIKPLNALLLGEAYARSMGLNVTVVRAWIIAATSLLAGSITAFCGPIAFLGLAVPHLVRGLFNTSDHKLLVPFVCLLGAALTLACDLIAQLPGSELTLPINAVTSLFGAPVVVWVILQRRNMKASFSG